MKIKGIEQKQLALFISDFLNKKGIKTVLTGGACVVIYTKGEYTSFDLDFVLSEYGDRKKVSELLAGIGFLEKGRYLIHPDTPFFLDFLSPPLSVGEEPVKEIKTLKENKMTLTLLSATDCVKDRLAAFYHWNDKQSLFQAVMVTKKNIVDQKEINRWSIKEGMADKFKIFKDKLG